MYLLSSAGRSQHNNKMDKHIRKLKTFLVDEGKEKLLAQQMIFLRVKIKTPFKKLSGVL